MAKRSISEEMLIDLIETGRMLYKSDADAWIFKQYPERSDNLICAAVVLAQAVIVKTVMVNWKLEDSP